MGGLIDGAVDGLINSAADVFKGGRSLVDQFGFLIRDVSLNQSLVFLSISFQVALSSGNLVLYGVSEGGGLLSVSLKLSDFLVESRLVPGLFLLESIFDLAHSLQEGGSLWESSKGGVQFVLSFSLSLLELSHS